jgi:hypothetical protein
MRPSSNSVETRPAIAGAATAGMSPICLSGPQALLLHQALNALLNGIRGIQFETQVGMSEEALRDIFDELDVWIGKHELDADGVIVISDAGGLPISSWERVCSPVEIKALRNSLEVVMLDLAQSEFFTRTGFSLEEAKQLLDRLNSVLLDPLHLEQASESVAH